jgi:hypothetical protein
MNEDADRYWKLRPTAPTPEAEVCHCPDRPQLVLQYHLAPNPLVCARCNGEVPPEQLGFSAEVAELVATWRELAAALFALELDSGEYEQYARQRLLDPQSRVNQLGLQAVAQLSQHCRTYYGWFVDEEARDRPAPSACPRCHGPLVPLFAHRVCDACSILVPAR